LVGVPIVFFGLYLIAMVIWFPVGATRWWRIGYGSVGSLVAAFGIVFIVGFAVHRPHWRSEPRTYCNAHGGPRFAAATIFGATEAIVCTDGSAEDYRGWRRWENTNHASCRFAPRMAGRARISL